LIRGSASFTPDIIFFSCGVEIRCFENLLSLRHQSVDETVPRFVTLLETGVTPMVLLPLIFVKEHQFH
jgi:hypothetical protein